MLLDPETFDLVQHIDTVLSAHPRGGVRRARLARAHAVGDRDLDARSATRPSDIDSELRRLRGYVTGLGRKEGLRVGSAGHASVQPVRAPADHRPRPLPRARRPAPVRRAPRAHLRDARPRRRRRAGQVHRRPHRDAEPPRRAARALGLLPVLARRADRARVDAADGLRRVPALGRPAALRRLRGVRARRRPAREDRLHRRLHAHLVGHPPASQVGHARGAGDGRGHARGRRRRHRRVHSGAREALLRRLRRRPAAPDLPPDARDREQVARRPLRPRGARDGPRHRTAEPRARGAAHPPDAPRDRAVRGASSAPTASSPASRRSSRAETAPTGSAASTTRTATSPRSSARSPTRPRTSSSSRWPRDRRRGAARRTRPCSPPPASPSGCTI